MEKTEVTGGASPLGRAASRAAAKAEAGRRKLSLRDRLAARKASQHDEDEEPKVAPSATALGSTAAASDRAVSDRAVSDRDVPVRDVPERDEAERDESDPTELDTTDTEEESSSSAREWAILIGQGVVAVIAGALLFKGFEKLWDMLPWVALILAVLVIVGLVAMVRILRRTDDITSFVIAVVVGMIVTLGPLAFMLASG